MERSRGGGGTEQYRRVMSVRRGLWCQIRCSLDGSESLDPKRIRNVSFY